MKAQKYIAHRNITVSSLCGRSVEFKKGEPTLCPPAMHAELMAMGIMPVDPVVDTPESVSNEPTVQGEREAALFAMFEKLSLRARREDFTAVGVPHASVLAKELGWGQLNGKERDTAWAKWNLEKTTAE